MRRVRTLTLLLILALLTSGGYQPARAQSDQHYFTETGFSVGGKFLAYWQANGGLVRFGYPISAEMAEQSPLDGKSVLVWEQAGDQNKCPNCPPTLIAEDILSGQRYDLGAGSMVHASYAHAVAWLADSHTNLPYGEYNMMYKNLDSGLTLTVTTVAPRSVRAIAVSASYIAWQGGAAVRVYNLKSGAITTMAEDAISFALDGSQLVWGSSSSLSYANLDSDAPPITLYNKRAEALTIKGDYVLWSSNGGFGECGPCDIWSLKMSDRIALPLITGYPDIYSPQVAGEYLVWTDLSASNTLYTSLSGVFAAGN